MNTVIWFPKPQVRCECPDWRAGVGVDSGGCMKLGPGLSFSWKRALGVTKAKRRVSKKTGIPLTRGGRRIKLGKWMGMK